jgi:hypothetical protein
MHDNKRQMHTHKSGAHRVQQQPVKDVNNGAEVILDASGEDIPGGCGLCQIEIAQVIGDVGQAEQVGIAQRPHQH